jgi:4-carboxymuconolactone decarboxylase
VDDSKQNERSQQVIKQLNPGKVQSEFFGMVEEYFPDFVKMTRGHLFGGIWARPGLGLRDRSLITIASLVTNLRDENGLRAQILMGLKNGLKEQEIFEVILHVMHYAGWPSGANAMRIAIETLHPKTPA